MNKYNSFSILFVVLGAVLIGLLVYSCANRGYPEGGPKDITPPKVTLEQPESYSNNFDKKNINIYFDEYVQLKNITEKFIISPPQLKKPKVRLRGKYVQVNFVDSLKPNTTYSLDFADAIVDNNEGNPLGYYRYVFSTGNVIDSLELSGNVLDAESNEPMLNTYVFLYRNHADSVPVLQIPDYMARTDSSGFFRVTNLKNADYKIVAIDDSNRDYKFTPEGEQVAFMDTLIRPLVIPMVKLDTIHNDSLKTDSIVRTEYLAYGPNNLYLRMFQEKLTQLYLVDGDRKEREKLSFMFSIPAKNDFKIDLLGQKQPENWYITEHTVGNDTINLWMTDSTIYKQDSLKFVLNYLRSDSLGIYVPYADTVKYVFSDKKIVANKKRIDENKKTPVDFLKINTLLAAEQDLNTGITLEFDRPILTEGLKNIQLLEKVDSLYVPVGYKLKTDSLKIRQFIIEKDWKPEVEYMLKVDSAVIFDIYDRHNDKLEKKFKVRNQEYYGSVLLTVSGVDGRQVIIQLYKSESSKSDKGKKTFNVVAEKIMDKDATINFNYLHAGKYKIRAIIDKNRNGKWDTGLYLKKIQPEEIIYLPVELNVKQNFDIEQDFNLNLPYKEDELKAGNGKNAKNPVR